MQQEFKRLLSWIVRKTPSCSNSISHHARGQRALAATPRVDVPLFLAAFISVVLSGAAIAQEPVVIDRLDFPQAASTEAVAPSTVTSSLPLAADGPASGILGGQRDISLSKNNGLVDRLFRASVFDDVREVSVLSEGSVLGNIVFTWDGPDDDAGSIDPIGLRTGTIGVDLTQGCPLQAQSVSFAVGNNQPPDNDISAILTLYTDASNYSSLELVIEEGAQRIVAFEFDDPAWVDVGNGATFSNVGAVQLEFVLDFEATDFTIDTPITACGRDFGDSPDDTAGGFDPSNSFFYETLSTTNVTGLVGAFHTVGGPWLPDLEIALGSPSLVNDTDSEIDGQESENANGDDNADSDDERAVFLPRMPRGDVSIDPDLGPVSCDGLEVGPSEYCATVRVANPTELSAQLVAWIDFNANEAFGSNCSNESGLVSAGCERSAANVRLGDLGLTHFGAGNCSHAGDPSGTLIGDGVFSSGNIPPFCEGVVVVTWDLSEAPTVTTNQTYARFRITTDRERGFFGAGTAIAGVPTQPVHYEFQSNGEVEDHLVDQGTLPVSIHRFESRFIPQGLMIEWGTVSETRNAGYDVWGDLGNGPELLTSNPIPSKAIDAVSSQAYSITVPDLRPGQASNLIITATDTEGNEEVFGLFEPGKFYGRKSDPRPIAWNAIRQQVDARMAERAHAEHRREPAFGAAANFEPRSSADSTALAVDVKVSSSGMQRVTWQDLHSAGLDLTGVANERIAVTLDGKPISRHVLGAVDTSPVRSLSRAGGVRGSSSAEFGPGGSIRFWGVRPEGRDALYMDDYVYRISIDPELAVVAESVDVKPKPGAEFHLQREFLNEDNAYSFTSPLDDPWYAARLRADTSNEYTRTIEVDQWLVSDQPAQLELVLAGGNDSPTSPNHHVRVLVNGEVIDDVFFTGSVEKRISLEVPAGQIHPGSNTVTVLAPGGTDAQFDIVVVDRLALSYPRRLQADSNRLLVERAVDDGGVTAHGFTTSDTVAYAWDGEVLSELTREQFSRGSVRVPTVRNPEASYWISAKREMHRPQVMAGIGPNELLEGASGDLVIIGHPAFLPLHRNESHPLNDYIANRIDAGWSPVVFDITDIQMHYGHGMALPQAVNRFLADAETAFEFEHVLLVGSDSYDYNDNLGLGSISFIPTHYAATRFINYTPSDALLTDLDGDGLADKAVGRWPVRTLDDLRATVTKTLDWVAGGGQDRSAIWVTDSEDPNVSSFRGQANRMFGLLDDAGWPDSNLDRIFWGDVEPLEGLSIADSMRAQFFDRLEQGRALTGFSGHGAPSMWTFQGLLTPNDLNELYNEGSPTLIGTLTCYTSYFVSPFNDTVAHRWMNGYREDAAGNQIPGVPNGAVAIHGAATLSNYAQNELFARNVLEHQLDGLTLGEAVYQARSEARIKGIEDLVINWTLLGDPTLRLDGLQ